MELAEYDFVLKHKPGKTHLKPDILSRKPDLKRGEKDNENVTMLKLQHFQQQEIIMESLDSTFMEQIKASQEARDRVVQKMLNKKCKGWSEDEEKTVLWDQRIYVPCNK